MPFPFEQFAEIGSGDDTIVYKGHETGSGKKVAIKCLKGNWQDADPTRRDQFLREAKAQAALSDPHLVSVIAIDPSEGRVVMEYMEESVATERGGGSLPAERVRAIVVAALQGLEYLHNKGIVHGRVRPSNLLSDEQGRVKLADCAFLDAQSQLAQLRGSHQYLAPELISSDWGQIGSATDLYCLGFAALELLLGKKFESQFGGVDAPGEDGQNAWMRWHASTAVLRPVGDLVPGVPADLAEALDAMLVKHVDQRASSAAELLDILHADLASTSPREKIDEPLPSAPKRSGTSIDAKTWIIGGACLLAVLLVVVFALLPSGTVALRVTTTPPAATIYFDGDPSTRQTTPATLQLRPGKHKLRIELQGYEPQEHELEAFAGKSLPELTATLRQNHPFTIKIECDVPYAVVTLGDGRTYPIVEGFAAWDEASASSWPRITVSADSYEPQIVERSSAKETEFLAVAVVRLRKRGQ